MKGVEVSNPSNAHIPGTTKVPVKGQTRKCHLQLQLLDDKGNQGMKDFKEKTHI